MYNVDTVLLQTVLQGLTDAQVGAPPRPTLRTLGSCSRPSSRPLSVAAVPACLRACVLLAWRQVELPFKLSPTEWDIITSAPQPPCSTILLGRSGTGKTTCAVYR